MLDIQTNILLKTYTTFKIGGPAKFFVIIKNENELRQAFSWAKQNNLPYFILGNGSNILINDKGFNGLVIKMEKSEFCVKGKEITTGAGSELIRVIEEGWLSNLTGLEFAYGIPGTLGGAVYGNAGAFGEQISDKIKSVLVLDKNLKVVNLKKKDCQFNYRQSIFKKNKDLIILSATLKLEKSEIKTAQAKAHEILNTRYNGQPAYPNAGCVFKNIREEKFNNFIKNNPDLEIPEKFLENKVIPVAWLIEQLGLKGKKIGKARISERHANFIINTGNATAEDVVKLISLIKTKIRDKFNVQLEEEIQLVGF